MRQRGTLVTPKPPTLYLPGQSRDGNTFTPKQLSGLVLWLDAANVAQANGTAVSTWTDASGLGNNATQGTSAAQPTYLAAGVNGHPAVSFDGVDDYLTLTSTLTTPATIIAAATATHDGYVMGKNTLAVNHQVRIMRGGTNTLSLYDGSTEIISSTMAVAFSTASIVEWLSAGSNATAFYQNGTNYGSTGSEVANTLDTVGASTAGSGVGLQGFLNGTIANLLFYNRLLSTSERHQVEAYLGGRYGISVVAQ